MRETGRRVDPPSSPAAPRAPGGGPEIRARRVGGAANDNRITARALAIRVGVVVAAVLGAAVLILTLR